MQSLAGRFFRGRLTKNNPGMCRDFCGGSDHLGQRPGTGRVVLYQVAWSLVSSLITLDRWDRQPLSDLSLIAQLRVPPFWSSGGLWATWALMIPRTLLRFPEHCRTARFLRREKRFRVEIELDGGRLWVHTNNSGSMLGLLRPGMEVFVSPAANPARKLPYTLELVRPSDAWIGVNTLTPNRMLKKVWEHGLIDELRHYGAYRAEAKSAIADWTPGWTDLTGLFGSRPRT